MRCFLAIAVAVSSITGVLLAQTKPAVPLEPIAAILEAFDTHDVVALAKGVTTTSRASRFVLP